MQLKPAMHRAKMSVVPIPEQEAASRGIPRTWHKRADALRERWHHGILAAESFTCSHDVAAL